MNEPHGNGPHLNPAVISGSPTYGPIVTFTPAQMTQAQVAVAFARHAMKTVWRHRMIVMAVFAVLMLCSLVLIYKMPRMYGASASLLIVNGNSRNDPTLSSPDLPSIAASSTVLERVQKKLALDSSIPEMKSRLTTKPPPFRSGILKIVYSDRSPIRAATIVNGVADELARYFNSLSSSRYDADLSALDREMAAQKATIARLNANLIAGSGSLVVAAADKTSGASPLDQVNDLRTQRALAVAALKGDLADVRAVTLDAQTRQKLERRDILDNDQRYHTLLNGVTSTKAQLDEARAHYTESFPGVQALETQVRSLDADVGREAASALTSPDAFSPSVNSAVNNERKAEALAAADRAKVTALDEQIVMRGQQLANQGSIELLRLQRDGAVAAYEAIALHRANSLANRADALSLGSVDVVDRATASDAQAGIGPLRLIATFTFIAALLALACAFLAEQLDPSLRRTAQIESLYGRPVVAILGTLR